jgi:hypothetical protein
MILKMILVLKKDNIILKKNGLKRYESTDSLCNK